MKLSSAILYLIFIFGLNAGALAQISESNVKTDTFRFVPIDFSKQNAFSFVLPKVEIGKQVKSTMLVPKTIFTHPSAFFCRLENKIWKSAPMPIKFRLGDADYVDRLEGKSN